MRNENYNECENALKGLMSFLGELPQATIKMLNVKRYTMMLQAAAKLTALLKENVPNGEINVDINEKFNLGSVTVELENLTVDSPDVFADIISCADNFEIYPLTNGKIRLDITFQGVLKSIA